MAKVIITVSDDEKKGVTFNFNFEPAYEKDKDPTQAQIAGIEIASFIRKIMEEGR